MILSACYRHPGESNDTFSNGEAVSLWGLPRRLVCPAFSGRACGRTGTRGTLAIYHNANQWHSVCDQFSCGERVPPHCEATDGTRRLDTVSVIEEGVILVWPEQRRILERARTMGVI